MSCSPIVPMRIRQSTGPRWKLATFSGHTIYVEAWFLALVAFFVFSGLQSAQQLPYQLMWAPILFFGILLHELGHAAAFKKSGFGTSTIVLQGMGGVAINHRANPNPNQGIFIALAGPAVTLALALLSFGGLLALNALAPANAWPLLRHLLQLSAMVNAFWLLFNLLPIFPMDGGQALFHVLRKRNPQRQALANVAKISLGTLMLAAALALYFLNGGIFILLILGFFAYTNWQLLEQTRAR
ncbi:site-2 protease family protein [Lujinxingia litoralis]|uniref:site-2 protease family protein n=1 Tax=Lujinxingia litoralis TaxID=2211119 RepID=UPI003D31D168